MRDYDTATCAIQEPDVDSNLFVDFFLRIHQGNWTIGLKQPQNRNSFSCYKF